MKHPIITAMHKPALALAFLLITHFIGAAEKSGVLVEYDTKKIVIKEFRWEDSNDPRNVIITLHYSFVKEKALPTGFLTYTIHSIEVKSAVNENKKNVIVDKDIFDAIFDPLFNIDIDQLFLDNFIVWDGGWGITLEIYREYGTVHGEKKYSKQIVLFAPHEVEGKEELNLLMGIIYKINEMTDIIEFIRQNRMEMEKGNET